MDFFTSFKICGSGLAAQRAKMDVVASNLANVNTTSTPEGGPYRRKMIAFDETLRDALNKVKVDSVVDDGRAFKTVYDPSHPDADAKGFVTMPNVNPVLEMADMISATRAYEACVTALDATKNMALKTLDIGK
jgi:flagellar basal-body rod protein FlgC